MVEKNLVTNKSKFHEKIVHTLGESMKEIFGQGTVEAVYYYLEKKSMAGPEDILEKPKTFVRATRELFGETGAEVIETLLVRDLRKKFRIDCERKVTIGLADCLDELKAKYLKE